MLLYELMRDVRTYEAEVRQLGQNPAVNLDVVTPAVGERYGSEYQGELVKFGGVYGRLGDVPAYLGGEAVVSHWWDGDVLQVRI